MTQKKVLIIDDEAEIRRNLNLGLTQEGYTCTMCSDAISAIRELARLENYYDYLISDIFMPDIDGFKMLKVIKKRCPELPVVVISGFGDEKIQEKVLLEKNSVYLNKPFEIQELVKILQKFPSDSTPCEATKVEATQKTEEGSRSYFIVSIQDKKKSREIYETLHKMENITSCEAVRGDVDVILHAQAPSQEKIQELHEKIKQVDSIKVSMSEVDRLKLDEAVYQFIQDYKNMEKPEREFEGTTSYLLIDIDGEHLQKIFTSLFFMDGVILCDPVEKGEKLIGVVYGSDTARSNQIIEKLKRMDGVLRVREATIIKMKDM